MSFEPTNSASTPRVNPSNMNIDEKAPSKSTSEKMNDAFNSIKTMLNQAIKYSSPPKINAERGFKATDIPRGGAFVVRTTLVPMSTVGQASYCVFKAAHSAIKRLSPESMQARMTISVHNAIPNAIPKQTNASVPQAPTETSSTKTSTEHTAEEKLSSSSQSDSTSSTTATESSEESQATAPIPKSEIEKNQEKVTFIIAEIVDTEKSYLNSLKFSQEAIQNLRIALKEQHTGKEPYKENRNLTGLAQIYNENYNQTEKLITKIEIRNSKKPFDQELTADDIIDIYSESTEYFRSLTDAASHVQQLNELYKNQYKKAHQKLNENDINEHMRSFSKSCSATFQRGPRIQLLIKELTQTHHLAEGKAKTDPIEDRFAKFKTQMDEMVININHQVGVVAYQEKVYALKSKTEKLQKENKLTLNDSNGLNIQKRSFYSRSGMFDRQSYLLNPEILGGKISTEGIDKLIDEFSFLSREAETLKISKNDLNATIKNFATSKWGATVIETEKAIKEKLNNVYFGPSLEIEKTGKSENTYENIIKITEPIKDSHRSLGAYRLYGLGVNEEGQLIIKKKSEITRAENDKAINIALSILKEKVQKGGYSADEARDIDRIQDHLKNSDIYGEPSQENQKLMEEINSLKITLQINLLTEEPKAIATLLIQELEKREEDLAIIFTAFPKDEKGLFQDDNGRFINFDSFIPDMTTSLNAYIINVENAKNVTDIKQNLFAGSLIFITDVLMDIANKSRKEMGDESSEQTYQFLKKMVTDTSSQRGKMDYNEFFRLLDELTPNLLAKQKAILDRET